MRFSTQVFSAGLALSSFALASPLPNGDSEVKDKRSFVERDGTNYTVFEHAATGAKLEFVTNSGICETTPGVNQYSGYLSVGTNMNMQEAPALLPFLLSSNSMQVVLVFRSSKQSHHSPSGNLVQWGSRLFFDDWLVSGEWSMPFCQRWFVLPPARMPCSSGTGAPKHCLRVPVLPLKA